MKKVLKILAIVLCFSIFGIMAIGSSSSDSSSDKEIASVETVNPKTDDTQSLAEVETQEPVEVEEESSTNSEISIEPRVLYDENGIKISTDCLEDGLFGPGLKLLIENNSTQNITVQSRKANVNGYMVTTMLSAEVAIGKKANDTLVFETSALEECGINTIASMEFSLLIFDTDSWDTITETDMIKIDTSAAATYTQTYDDSGTVLVDANGIKIVGKGLSANNSFWGPGVIVYIENNSGNDITIQTRDVSVNGFMTQTSMSTDVLDGKKAISAVQFFSTDLEENGITDISDVELYFTIFDLDSWDTIFDSDIISITF